MTQRLVLMQQWLAGTLPPDFVMPMQFPPAINNLMGIKLTAIDAGRCSMRMPTDPAQHGNPLGTIHGGVLCDLGDAAIGTAHATALAPEESFTTVDLRINFFRPVWQDELTATAQVQHLGRTLGYYECDIYNARGKMVAKLTSTLMTLRGAAAAGR